VDQDERELSFTNSKAKVKAKNKKNQLKKGFTTGSAATAAAKAALHSLIYGECPANIKIKANNDYILNIPITCCFSSNPLQTQSFFYCGVKKDAGDDPDVTDGILVFSRVKLTDSPGVFKIKGGEGVGMVTKPGLPVRPGEPAINPGPKEMLKNNLVDLIPLGKGLEVEIQIPEGAMIAKKTLNEKLGIEKGISVLGTTGIVEPYSKEAYKDSLYVQLHQVKSWDIKTIVFTPGKIGENNAKKLNIPEKNIVFISNFVGSMLSKAKDTLDSDCSILIFGHIGKLSKLAAGIFQTHSREADGRKEVFITHAALNGGSISLLKQIYSAGTTEEILGLLEQSENLKSKVLNSIVKEVTFRAREHIRGYFKLGAALTDREGNILAACDNAKFILEKEGWSWEKLT